MGENKLKDERHEKARLSSIHLNYEVSLKFFVFAFSLICSEMSAKKTTC